MKNISRIQFITNAIGQEAICKQVQDSIDAGIDWVQLRMKDTNKEDKLSIAKAVMAICRQSNVQFIINDDVFLAKRLHADGVHLGMDDMHPIEAREILGDDLIIGLTCNTIDHIENRYKYMVDYIGLGPFQFTSTKKNLSPLLGINGYKKIIKEMNAKVINIPIIAIGGIRTGDIKEIINTGVHGIALSSLITSSDNKKEIINQIHSAI